jgi:hypothetical protein
VDRKGEWEGKGKGKLTWVAEDDDRADLGHRRGWEELGGVVDELATLRVAAHDDSGVGTLLYGGGDHVCPTLGSVRIRALPKRKR